MGPVDFSGLVYLFLALAALAAGLAVGLIVAIFGSVFGLSWWIPILTVPITSVPVYYLLKKYIK